MENLYHCTLDFKFELDTRLIQAVQNSLVNTNEFQMFTVDVAELDHQLTVLLENLNLKVEFAQIFYTPPGMETAIHIDGGSAENTANRTKLNWVYGAKNSTMEWWHPETNIMDNTYTLSPAGTPYLMFDKNKCRRVWKAHITNPSLVNAIIPHNVNNSTNEGRWCLSIGLVTMDKNIRISWQDALVYFSDYIKEE